MEGRIRREKEKVEFHVYGESWPRSVRSTLKGRKASWRPHGKRQWEGEDGVKRNRSEIVAENFILLTVNAKEMARGSCYTQDKGALKPERSRRGAGAAKARAEEVSLDDLPF